MAVWTMQLPSCLRVEFLQEMCIWPENALKLSVGVSFQDAYPVWSNEESTAS